MSDIGDLNDVVYLKAHLSWWWPNVELPQSWVMAAMGNAAIISAREKTRRISATWNPNNYG